MLLKCKPQKGVFFCTQILLEDLINGSARRIPSHFLHHSFSCSFIRLAHDSAKIVFARFVLRMHQIYRFCFAFVVPFPFLGVCLTVSLLLQHGMVEQKRCRQLLYTRCCDRLGRGEQCWTKHRNWFECIRNGFDFAFFCYFNCS